MSSAIDRATLRGWLDSPDAVLRLHAANLLAVADGRPESPPRRSGPSAWLSRVNTCLYRECQSGCEGSRCHWRRDVFDRPDVVSLARCVACLSDTARQESGA